ncbi:hypothetical protein AYL99_06554 [Fonsecaea erecta]|uniref:Uncharacterized protein n=1 Tax=Fonsecaea erecta TaxID=1367422 RepID=A0A178ZIL1_9EURO|nr:hypothetical protein AYL99_06554 [Fonsecaea erecta]OAP59256.1 hypothetical protein AYL99_06554 [Fonsecaea erecta]
MAGRLMSPGPQVLAYNELRHVVSRLPRIRSREFVSSLFSEDSSFSMQMYVVEHVAYWIRRWRETEDWARLFNVHERFGMEMALAIVRSDRTKPVFLHPAD